MTEIYKDIKGYEGLYQVSNYGNVRSLDRVVECSNGQIRRYKGIQLALPTGHRGYAQVSLHNEGSMYVATVHKLVWQTFGDRGECLHRIDIDHIDHNKKNNRIENLRLISHRENRSRLNKKSDKSSRYTGVTFNKELGKFRASIRMKSKSYYLGVYDSEEDAHKEYQKQLKSIEENGIAKPKIVKKTSKYRGVSKHSRMDKWIAYFRKEYLGCFTTEEEAYFAYQEKKQEYLNECALQTT